MGVLSGPALKEPGAVEVGLQDLWKGEKVKEGVMAEKAVPVTVEQEEAEEVFPRPVVKKVKKKQMV